MTDISALGKLRQGFIDNRDRLTTRKNNQTQSTTDHEKSRDNLEESLASVNAEIMGYQMGISNLPQGSVLRRKLEYNLRNKENYQKNLEHRGESRSDATLVEMGEVIDELEARIGVLDRYIAAIDARLRELNAPPSGPQG